MPARATTPGHVPSGGGKCEGLYGFRHVSGLSLASEDLHSSFNPSHSEALLVVRHGRVPLSRNIGLASKPLAGMISPKAERDLDHPIGLQSKPSMCQGWLMKLQNLKKPSRKS